MPRARVDARFLPAEAAMIAALQSAFVTDMHLTATASDVVRYAVRHLHQVTFCGPQVVA